MTKPAWEPVRLTDHYAEAAAQVHRRSFDAQLPWLASLHTPDEDERFFRNHVFKDCTVWGTFDDDDTLVGIIAFRAGWIDQLYVLPEHQGKGLGQALLALAQAENSELQLWTFQKNKTARRFYEKHGFVAVEFTDGRGNMEREADIRYRWLAPTAKTSA